MRQYRDLTCRTVRRSRWLLAGTGLVSATAAASRCWRHAAQAPAACLGRPRQGAAANFPATPAWQFWFVNHVTADPFFVPTQFGMRDAAALLGLSAPKWTGSTNSPTVSQMLSAIDTAVAAKANGIATTVINSSPADTSFAIPVAAAMNASMAVVSYNADGPIINGAVTPGTNRLCYVGQALYLSGQQMGERIKSLAKPGKMVVFIATPGSANIQPRYDGAASVLAPAGYWVKRIGDQAIQPTGVPLAERAFFAGNQKITGAFAVDAGSTEVLGAQLASSGLAGKMGAGGFDLTPGTLTAINLGQLDFTINQDPTCRASCRCCTSTCST